MDHAHWRLPKSVFKIVREDIQQQTPDLFITGHSHILKVMHDKKLNLLHMNPGAVGIHGFHKVRTMLRFEVSNGKIQHLEVIEFERRIQKNPD